MKGEYQATGFPWHNQFMHLPQVDERIEIVSMRFPNARLPSRIREAREERLVVSVPMMAGEPLKLSIGEKVVLRWRDESLFIAATRSFSNGGLLVELEILETLPRQRRGYFRWFAALPMRFSRFDGDGNEQSYITQTINLSGGGLAFSWTEQLQENEEIELEITFERRPLIARGRVVISRPNSSAVSPYQVAVEFIRIAEADRSRIVRFIFRRQFASRSHGK